MSNYGSHPLGCNEQPHWRSTEVYRCEICGTKTNHWFLWGAGAAMYKHNAIMCPGDHYKEHDKLETLLKRHLELSDQINDYRGILERATGTDREQATKAVEILEAQRDLLKTGIENMRELFMDKVDDLMGDTSWTILTFYPSTRYCFKKDLPVRLPS